MVDALDGCPASMLRLTRDKGEALDALVFVAHVAAFFGC
jgi:hypothetical protein